MNGLPPEVAEGLFDALTAMRELAQSAAASAHFFRKGLEEQGWSPHVAEQMAATLYDTAMGSIAASMNESIRKEDR